MLSFAPFSLALIAALPVFVSALPPAESYAGCLDTAPPNLQAVVPIVAGGLVPNQQQCSTYCFQRNFQYAYVFPNAASCGCATVGPTASQFSAATNARMGCTAAQYDARITRTTFSTPICYSGFFGTDPDFPRRDEGIVSDAGTCFRRCIDRDGATIIPQGDGTGYQCICDQNGGDVDSSLEITCAKGTLVRFGDHVPGENVDGLANPGPSTFVKRQQREQLRLASQKEISYCPMADKACLVAAGTDSWECVDVQTELESCGGCMFGEMSKGASKTGVDCTTLPGVSMGGVTCTHGQCAIWACDPGFTLSGRECVATK